MRVKKLSNELGDLLKKIRCGKNLSQNELCEDIISRTYLSKIEHNTSYPTFYILKKIVSKLDISISELEYLLNEDNITSEPDIKENIINSFWKIKDDSKKEQLKNIIKMCKLYKKNDLLINDIYSISEVMLNFPDLVDSSNNCINKIKISKIWDRLNQMNLWTLNELKLASCCLFYFPTETAYTVAKRIQKNLFHYINYDNCDIQIFIIGQYINLTTIYINNKEFESAYKTNSLALKLSLNNCRYDYYYFCLGRKGILDNDIEKVTTGIHLLQELALPDYVKALKKELEHLSLKK